MSNRGRKNPTLDLTEKYDLDADGNVVKTATGATTIDRNDFLDWLADEKLAYLKLVEDTRARIAELEQIQRDENARLTELYNKIVPTVTDAEKQALLDTNLELNNKLARAFPTDFTEVTRTIVADK